MRIIRGTLWVLALAALVVLAAPQAYALCCNPDQVGQIADVNYSSSSVDWRVFAENTAVHLTVSTPCGIIERTYDKGEDPFFSIEELAPDNPDGSYTWQVRIEPVVSAEVQEALRESRISGDEEIVKSLCRKGMLPQGPFVQTGEFRVVKGAIVDLSGEEPRQKLRLQQNEAAASLGVIDGEESLNRVTAKTVISGDLTVYNSLCVGFDCLSSESYGSDTIRLKENNLRIHADDTSTAASFPRTDWRLEFNSNLNGGGSYFRVVDASASRNIMTLEANAPSNSLYVDDGGRVGLGTSTPSVELHLVNGDTPTLRLAQDGSSGFAPQTWDVAGNETSFFVRDTTSGSTLPFRIRPGASSNALVIDTDSDVGIGILSPTSALHVKRTNGTAKLTVEEASGTEAERTLLAISNNGNSAFDFIDTSADGSTWQFKVSGPSIRFNKSGTGGDEIVIRDRLDGTGQATFVVNGSVQATNVTFVSSREKKTAFESVDGRDVLDRVTQLPISRWAYTDLGDNRRHIGPMAEDFEGLFQLGTDGKTISVTDINGVSLAAIQGLNSLLEERIEQVRNEKDSQLNELRARLESLEAQLAERAVDTR